MVGPKIRPQVGACLASHRCGRAVLQDALCLGFFRVSFFSEMETILARPSFPALTEGLLHVFRRLSSKSGQNIKIFGCGGCAGKALAPQLHVKYAQPIPLSAIRCVAVSGPVGPAIPHVIEPV